ncbi:hypothetical protein Daus18300_006132 [Diaporthe australafricana]|uniref:DUF967 domain-containing protein n=1 Tax=Diaporthe australafricana TaxID=127596 RepID=A0ABR3WW17_9PEZI
MSAIKVWSRRPEAEEKARQPPAPAGPIAAPPSDVAALKQDGDSFTLDAFTFDDAWVLGSLLRRRLLPIPTATVISIALANSGQVLFQAVTGSGVMPDNEIWVQRKRNTVLRWGSSTWLQHCKYDGDEAAFKAKFGMSEADAGRYAIHGGAVPIRVKGVEGVVAVVVVSGLKQHEDHGVIVEVIKENWQ